MRIVIISLSAALLFASAPLMADTVRLKDTIESEATGPTRGQTMSSVEARFGAPSQRHDAVGDPPITRWDYPGFSVFFEYDKVIHAVTPR